MDAQMLTTETHDETTLIRLTHGKVNAFDVEFLQEWIATLDRIDTGDPTAVVVTGSGSVFSAGVDLRRLLAGGPTYVEQFVPLLGEAFLKTFTFSKPLVAAVNGHAIAGGCILACACDYRVMAQGPGRIGTPELAVGVPFPSIAMEILRLAVPTHRLQVLIYSGLTCTADDALANGLVDEVASPESHLDKALGMAGRLGSLAHASFALTKQAVRRPSLARIEAARDADREVLGAWRSEAVLDAVSAYVDRTLKK